MNGECEKHRGIYLENRKYIQDHYYPLYNHLYTLKEGIFVESFAKAIHNKTSGALHRILTEEHLGIYSFDLLKPEFCRQLLEEVFWFESWCTQKHIRMHPPNSMNNGYIRPSM